MEHAERQQWVEQVARINVRLNQEALGETDVGEGGHSEVEGQGKAW